MAVPRRGYRKIQKGEALVIKFSRLSLIAFLTSIVALSGAAVTQAQTGSPRHDGASTGTLTVNITRTGGTVWGRVKIKPLGKTCNKTTCLFKKVKLGTKLTLTETPTNSASWPFSHWTVNKRAAGTGTTLKVKMSKNLTVGVVYVLPGGTLTVNITSTGTVWGKVKIDPLGKTCTTATCTYKNVPLSQNLTLTETPTDSSTWPFGGWTLDGADKGKATTVQFSMNQKDSVTAFYCDGAC